MTPAISRRRRRTRSLRADNHIVVPHRAADTSRMTGVYHALDGGRPESTAHIVHGRGCFRWFYCRALIRLNSASARSNLSLKSHIASRISRKVADVLARSARPYAKMLLFRRYPMILGSEIL